jgi:chromosome partitioning protein
VRTITIVNQKGGCGKTTTAINLAAVYARRGHRTLVIDIDPQGHCAAGLGVPEQRIEYSIGDAMRAEEGDRIDVDRLCWEVARNLHLAPSTMRMASLEAPGGGLHELPDRDKRLGRVIAELDPHYDLCLVDCPPTLGLLTFNALRAARETLVPVETGYFSLKGAEKQWETIQRVIKRIARPIACHLMATLHDPTSALARDILAQLRRRFAGQILPVVIREHEELREAASLGQAITEYAPESDARADYEALADWLDDHVIHASVEIEIISQGVEPVRPDPPDEAEPDDGSDEPLDLHMDSGRAGELAARLRRLAVSSAVSTPAAPIAPPAPFPPISRRDAPLIVSVLPSVRRVDRLLPLPSHPLRVETMPSPETSGAMRERLYGARLTAQGVLFVQPAPAHGEVFIAGDFNLWSATATPLRYNAAVGVVEAIVPMPPGRYQYRLVVDGRWHADPYNTTEQVNGHGERNSVIEVPNAAPHADQSMQAVT